MKIMTAVFLVLLAFVSPAVADWQVGISAGYSPNYIALLKGTGVSSGSSYTADYTLFYEGSAEFGLDVWNTPPQSWGFISGFQYSGERKLTSGSLNGITITASGNVSTYQTHFLYAGTAYRWQTFYIPLGITYGITNFTPATPMTVEVKSGVGALIGLGWFIGNHFVIEYIGRSASTSYKASSDGDSASLTGTVSSASLNLKYFF